MKILIIINNISGKGGVERIVTGLSNELYRNYNYHVQIASLFSNPASAVYYEVDPSIEIIHLNNNNLKNMKVCKQFLKFNQLNYEYIISCSVSIAFLALITRAFCHSTTKILAWEHSQYQNSPFFIRLLRILIYPHLDRIITLTQHDGEIFKKFSNRVSVIPNFNSMTSEKSSKYTNHTLISVGRLEYEKGFDMLIDAYNLIRDDIGDWLLEIYGEGKECQNLNERIRNCGLENKIFIKPFTRNILDNYLGASIFVCSSRSESFSMVLVEAMACGLPCISFDCKIGPREIIQNGIDGYLVKSDDIKELSKKIKLLANDLNLRLNIGQNAKNHAKEYTVKKIIRKWKDIFENK